MSEKLERLVRSHWWSAVASVTRSTGGDLGLAEDAVQEACAAALTQWPAEGAPTNPLGWLIGVGRRRAIDHRRREVGRGEREAAAVREQPEPPAARPRRPTTTWPWSSCAATPRSTRPPASP